MRIVIIGGTGHVGTYLVPRLVALGHEIICVSRAQREPYKPHAAWNAVQRVQVDRKNEEAAGTFGKTIAALRPDAVIDMICFTPESCRHLIDALRGQVRSFLHCGTVWVNGYSVTVPMTEDQPRRPLEKYGREKAAIEDLLLGEARRNGFPATVLRAGHIVGEGWISVNPAGNFDPDCYRRLSRGEELLLPNNGLETLHHVHADDVAQAFVLALAAGPGVAGHAFNIVSPQAITLRGYADAAAAWFGREANLKFLPLQQWKQTTDPKHADATEAHVLHSQCASIDKARRLLGYQPRYTSLEAVYESVQWAIAHGMLEI